MDSIHIMYVYILSYNFSLHRWG